SEGALGRGDALAARVDLARDAQRAPESLERGLGHVVIVATGRADMERGPGRAGERLERVLDELEREPADALAAERQVDDRVRTSADLQHRRCEGLVPPERDPAATGSL